MAVAHSAASESHAATTGSVSQTSFSWTHTQTGTPQGVLVFVHVANSGGNPVSSVTYGSVALTRVSGGAAVDAAGELGRTDLFFAGSGLPSGNQTVTVNRANTTDIMYASAATVTAATDTNVTGIVLLQGDGALTVQSVTDGGAPTNSLRYAAAYSGLAAPPPAGTGSTLLNSIDFGNYGIALVRETTAGTGARNVGFNNATTDDRAAVHVAVRELWNRTDTQTVGAFTLTGNNATLTKTSPKVITGETGAFTLTGQPASASAGYRVTADLGKFFLPERNIIKQSEQFDDINNWRTVRANALANNTAAPDGSITAEFIRETATTGTHVLASEPNNAIPAVVGPASYTFSCHLKANGRNATLRADGSGGGGSGASGEVLFDLATGGTTTLAAGTITASGATDAGNGWYRCWISFTTTQAGTCRADIYLYSTSTSYTGDGTSGIYAWGAQLEQSASLTEYDPTGLGSVTPITFKYNRAITAGTGAFTFTGNDATLTEAAAPAKTITADRGQFTLTGNPASTLVAVQLGGDVGKFFLPERNLVKYSEEIDTNAWTKVRASISPNATISPDGLLRGDKVVEDTSNSTHILQLQNSAPAHTAGVTYTYSWHLKAGERTLLNVAFGSDLGTFNDQAFDINLSTGVISNVSPSGFVSTPTATSVGNSWYRVSATVVANSSTLPVVRGRPIVGGSISYLGDGVSGYFIWGAQLEQGSAVSDYDPTGPAGATDAALRQQYKLTAEVGAFAFTGNPATLAKGRTITAETGTFTAAGQPATLLHKPRIEANTGSFALSGGAPALLRGRYLSGGAGEFIETGQPATFRRTWAVQAATGAFSFTGNPASLTELGAYEIDPIAGSFTLAGQPANLAQSQSLPITVGTFAFTGQPATLRHNPALAADRGLFTFTGQPAALKQGYRLDGGTGAFTFTGNPATLAKSAAKQFTAVAGVFTLAGQPAALRANAALTGERGQFTLAGQPATLRQNWRTTGERGQFLLTGNPAALTVTRSLLGGTGVFTFTGNPAGLADTDKLAATTGAFILTGLDATLLKASTARRRNVLIF